MHYRFIEENLKRSKKSLIYPSTLFKNVDASKIIYSLSDMKGKKLLELSKEIDVSDKSLTLKLDQLIKGNYILKDGYSYFLNIHAIKELFLYWIEGKRDQFGDPDKFFEKISQNKVFDEIFFRLMYSFRKMDIPLGGFFQILFGNEFFRWLDLHFDDLKKLYEVIQNDRRN